MKYASPKMLEYVYQNCAYARTVEYSERLLDYDDYLRMAEEMGYPMNRNDVLYPKNIRESHNALMKKYNQVRSELVNKGIKATADKLMKYRYESHGMIIIPAQSNEELIAESKALNHCVRTYADKIAKGKTGIMFVRKSEEPDRPYVTLELNGKKVIQVRAKNNSKPSSEVCDVVRKWEKQFRLSGW